MTHVRHQGRMRWRRSGSAPPPLAFYFFFPMSTFTALAGALRAARDDDLQDAIVVGRLQVLGVHV